MTPTDTYLLDLASQAKVTIEYVALPSDRDGDYSERTRTIRLRPGMHARRHRSALAHELAHAAFADVPSRFGPVNAKQERRADEWAALRLITLDDYRHAERLHDAHPGAMALELGVMRRIVEAYQRVLLRVGDTVYVKPKEGTGQWNHREQVVA